MRLLEQDIMNWINISPFLDSVCIPFYRYQIVQKELQLEEADLIEYISEELEKRLIGRLLLLPPYSFMGNDEHLIVHAIASIRKELVHSGFHYAFMVILEGSWGKEFVDQPLLHILSVNKEKDRELELERVYQEILAIWQSI